MLVHVEGEVALGGEGQRAVLAGEGAAVKSHKGMVSYEAKWNRVIASLTPRILGLASTICSFFVFEKPTVTFKDS